VQDPGRGEAGEARTNDGDIDALGKGQLVGHVRQARR